MGETFDVHTHLNFQVTRRRHNYHTYHCNVFDFWYLLLTKKKTFYHFARTVSDVFPSRLSFNQQVYLLESGGVTLRKITSLGQDTSCNTCPDNLLC